LEDPRRREETRPCLDSVVKPLRFRGHKEARVATYLG
jgi:hypothetical protein